MFRVNLRTVTQALPARNVTETLVLFSANLLFNVIANASFKFSITNPTWRSFLTWQVIGNIAGFITVLTLTGLLRFIPLHVAFPVTTGMAVIGVQVLTARLLFHEQISPAQWLGTFLVVVGIMLIGGR